MRKPPKPPERDAPIVPIARGAELRRGKGARAAARAGKVGLEATLSGLLADKGTFANLPTRIREVDALGDSREVRARTTLEKLLLEDVPTVKEHALRALASIGDKRSIPALDRAIKSELVDKGFRSQIREALWALRRK